MRTRENSPHTWEGMRKTFKKRFMRKKAWVKRFKKWRKSLHAFWVRISKSFNNFIKKLINTPNHILVIYGVLLLGVMIILSAIITIGINGETGNVPNPSPSASYQVTDSSETDNTVQTVHKDPGLATVAGQYKQNEVKTAVVDETVKEALKYPELSTVSLVSGVSLPIPVSWSPVAAAGTDLAFSRNGDSNVVISFSDLGSLSSINEGILASVKKTLESQGSVLTPFKTSDKGVVSFTASQGTRQVEVYLMILGGHGIMLTLTYDGKANSASSEVAWLVDTMIK